MSDQISERLQKAMARAGIASRRASEDLILAGRVKVNGKIVTELGIKIDPTRDRVTVDEEPVPVKVSAAPQKIYLMLNKPAGYLSTVSDPQGRPTIMDLVDHSSRLYPVGRLDADTEGLLLLTNDGPFANAISHPRFGVEKEYVALLDGIIAMKDLDRLRKGVAIPVEDHETGERIEHTTKPARVDLIRHEGSNSLVRFILKEGKKRQIRLMADTVKHPVIELKRVRLGPLKLSDLASGKSRNLSRQEVKELQEASKPTTGQAAPVALAAGPKGRSRRPAAAATNPAGRVTPFKSPLKSGRRFGERRFGEEPFGQTGPRRGPAPGRGHPAGPGRFESDEEAPAGRHIRSQRGRPAQGQTTEFDRPTPGPGRGRPAPDFERSAPDQGRPGRTFDRSAAEPARRPAPAFDRKAKFSPEDAEEGRTPFRFGKPAGRPGPAPKSFGGGPPSKRGKPHQSGFVPAAERPAPTPRQGRPPVGARPGKNPAGNAAPERGENRAGNRADGPRSGGPARTGRRG
jgi:pseudouridine synthase